MQNQSRSAFIEHAHLVVLHASFPGDLEEYSCCRSPFYFSDLVLWELTFWGTKGPVGCSKGDSTLEFSTCLCDGQVGFLFPFTPAQGFVQEHLKALERDQKAAKTKAEAETCTSGWVENKVVGGEPGGWDSMQEAFICPPWVPIGTTNPDCFGCDLQFHGVV